MLIDAKNLKQSTALSSKFEKCWKNMGYDINALKYTNKLCMIISTDIMKQMIYWNTYFSIWPWDKETKCRDFCTLYFERCLTRFKIAFSEQE